MVAREAWRLTPGPLAERACYPELAAVIGAGRAERAVVDQVR